MPRLTAVLLAAFVWAAPASARPILKHSEPAPSSVVQRTPHQVVLVFDTAVQPAPGIAVSRGGAGSVVAGKPYVPKGKPNEGNLGQGPYAVSWSAADVRRGELSSGAFVFSIGSGLPPEATAQPGSNGSGPGPWLLFAGLSVAAFLVVVRSRARVPLLAPGAALVAAVVGAVLWVVSKPGNSVANAAPPSGQTVTYAGEDDDLAVGLAVTPKSDDALGLRATVLGFNGPVKGLNIEFALDGHRAPAASCGGGCHDASLPRNGAPRNVAVTIVRKRHSTATLHFAGPTKWPAPQALDIASDAHHEVTTVYKMVAPNRLAYVGGGESVLIGPRRWDRAGLRARWVESPQLPPVQQPAPFWLPNIENAHVLRTDRVGEHPDWVVSFLGPSTPAWFTAWVDRTSYRTLRLEMVATTHFVHDRDGPFNAPITIQPPGS